MAVYTVRPVDLSALPPYNKRPRGQWFSHSGPGRPQAGIHGNSTPAETPSAASRQHKNTLVAPAGCGLTGLDSQPLAGGLLLALFPFLHLESSWPHARICKGLCFLLFFFLFLVRFPTSFRTCSGCCAENKPTHDCLCGPLSLLSAVCPPASTTRAPRGTSGWVK